MTLEDDVRSTRRWRAATDEELFENYRRTGDRALRNELVQRHLWLADRCARRYRDRGEPHDDLVQVGRFGLIKAVERYDPACGAFASFATPTIIGELKRHFRDKTWTLAVPRRAKELRSCISTATEELRHRLGRAPTVNELADYTGLSRERVVETLAASRAYRPSSIDVSLLTRTSPAVGPVDQTAQSERQEDRLIARDLIAQLDERERIIVYLTFFEGLTQREIGDRLGLGQVRVSRILAAARDTLRRNLVDNDSHAA